MCNCFSIDSPFQLSNKATGFCLVKTNNECNDIRWTSGDRLLVQQRNKCLGVQEKSQGSEVSLYDCDENSELQKWRCINGTVLALKGTKLYIELIADNTAALSQRLGPNNHLTIPGTTSGACTRTYRGTVKLKLMQLWLVLSRYNCNPCHRIVSTTNWNNKNESFRSILKIKILKLPIKEAPRLNYSRLEYQ